MRYAPLILTLTVTGLSGAHAPTALAQGEVVSRKSLQALEEFARLAREAMERLQGSVDPWVGPLSLYLSAPQDYLPPEVLPGGDIIIRRRAVDPVQPGPGVDL